MRLRVIITVIVKIIAKIPSTAQTLLTAKMKSKVYPNTSSWRIVLPVATLKFNSSPNCSHAYIPMAIAINPIANAKSTISSLISSGIVSLPLNN